MWPLTLIINISKMSSPGITSTSFLTVSEDNIVWRFCREPSSLSSRGSYVVDWRWSGDRSDSLNEQGSCSARCWSRSDSLEEWMCPPLPGQVPAEPTETSNGLMEASPENKGSTGETEIKPGGVKFTDGHFAISCIRQSQYSHISFPFAEIFFLDLTVKCKLCHYISA